MFTGTLETQALSTLLLALYRDHCTGELLLTERVTTTIYLRDGSPAQVRSDLGEGEYDEAPLGAVLVAQGALDEAGLRQGLHAAAGGGRLGAHLMRLGLIDEPALREALVTQTTRRLVGLLPLRDARFALVEREHGEGLLPGGALALHPGRAFFEEARGGSEAQLLSRLHALQGRHLSLPALASRHLLRRYGMPKEVAVLIDRLRAAALTVGELLASAPLPPVVALAALHALHLGGELTIHKGDAEPVQAAPSALTPFWYRSGPKAETAAPPSVGAAPPAPGVTPAGAGPPAPPPLAAAAVLAAAAPALTLAKDAEDDLPPEERARLRQAVQGQGGLRRGLSLLRAGRAEDAIEPLEEAARLLTGSAAGAEAAGQLAWARHLSGQLSAGACVQALREALRCAPRSASLYTLAGLCYQGAGRADWAQRCFEMALKLDADHAEAAAALRRLREEPPPAPEAEDGDEGESRERGRPLVELLQQPVDGNLLSLLRQPVNGVFRVAPDEEGEGEGAAREERAKAQGPAASPAADEKMSLVELLQQPVQGRLLDLLQRPIGGILPSKKPDPG